MAETQPLNRSAELKTVNGQTKFLPRRRLSRNGSLPTLAMATPPRDSPLPDGGSTGPSRLAHVSSAPQLPKSQFKQRGVMSEVVKAHRPEEVEACRRGPVDDAVAEPPQLRKSASASVFKLSRTMRQRAAEALPVDAKGVAAEVEPKVVEVHAHRAGWRPRKVTVERRKKWYESLDIEALLLQRGISFKPSNWAKTHWMNLDDFDNREFDIRSPQEWMEAAVSEEGVFLPLRAHALRLQEDNSGKWESCLCVGLDGEHFLVQWQDEAQASVSRLQILIFGEDPEVFADRVLFAFQALRRAQSRAQLNFFIDNMPIDDIKCLDIDQVARVLSLSRSSPKLQDVSMDQAVQDLIREVNLDYARTMNKIIFTHDQEVNRHACEVPELPNSDVGKEAEKGIFAGVNVCELEEEDENLCLRPIPWFALWPLPEYNFTQTFSQFCFASLYIKPEVVGSLCAVAKECLWLMDQRQYTTRFDKILKLDQFRQLQHTKMKAVSKDIREQWVANIIKIIQTNFEHVGKGWFNIFETNADTYAEGKIKKLLHMIRFMMEDSMRYFVLDSVEDYCHAMEAACPSEVVVNGLLDVRSEYVRRPLVQPAIRGGSLELRPPGRGLPAALIDELPHVVGSEGPLPSLKPGDGLFCLEIKTSPEGDKFVYSSEGAQALEVSDEVISTGLISIGMVPQVESSIVPQLFKTMVHKKTLTCPDAHNPWIKERRAALTKALQRSVPCLAQYLKLFSEHEKLLSMKPEEYVKAKAEADVSLEEAKTFIKEHTAKEQALLKAIPDSKIVGLFEISCAEIKKVLANKHQKTVQLLLDMLHMRFREMCSGICDNFSGIFATLRKKTTDIESISSMRDFIGSVPSEVSKLMPEIKRTLDTFHALEDYGIRLSPDDFFQRWRIFGSPKDTADLCEKTAEALLEAERAFLDEQVQEQAEFDENLLDLGNTIATFARYNDMEKVDEIYVNVESINEELKKAAVKAKLFNARELLFGKEVSDYSSVQTLAKEWEPFSQLWVTTYTWVKDSEKWIHGPFGKINAKECESWVMASTKTLFKALKAFEKRQDVGKILDICRDIKTQVDNFAPKVPIIVGLSNPGMRDRHWQQVTEKVGHTIRPDMEDFTLQKFLDLGMQDHAQTVADIGDRSGKELGIETQLRSMMAQWEKVYFDCSEPYRTTGTYILKGADEVIGVLDEQIVTTQAMQFSPFNKPFKEDIDLWNEKLSYVSECLDQWMKVQRAWMYLQPIFDSADIMKQLPTEGKKFKSVDNKWRQAMSKVNKDGHALSRLSEEGLLNLWTIANNDMDAVQKGLDDYLETKRGAFARFYFLSNDELLEILSQTKDPLRVQPFLSKVFEAMKELTFTDQLVATQMHSKEGETIDFVTHVTTSGKNVEVWMTEVEDQMLASIRNVIKVGVEKYVTTVRTQWVQEHPGQVVLNSSQVLWTAEVEEAIQNADLTGYHAKLKDNLLGLVRLVRGKITKLQRMSIGALVVIDVHAMDTIEKMAQDNISDLMSFEWISQLRYYWEPDDRQVDNLEVRMVQTPFPYGYEYLGNSFRLVITPLTDMCYMTLMGAQSLNLGGAPAGPAGTGKTETTKDLAKALAKQCVVFNCSPEMDYLMVGKFFKGLASSGAWCCFDEFNRINIEVLSVIAQQLLQLFGAKRELKSYSDTTELEFDGTMIRMRPTFNVFITMNPGYAGRSELPDNLAALFRPMAMMVPDYGLIGEISFYAFGFEAGRHLAKKMVTTFQLCSEQLSSQCHYDYGMRAVKTVIEAAGLNKRKYPDQSEGQILLRALRDVNVPKFLRDDLPLFDNIISDLFPGVERPVMDYGELESSCQKQSREAHWQPTEHFVKKQFELFDMIQVRHGMMLVGPTGGGKSCCYRALQAACSALMDPTSPDSPYQKVHVHCLNPKAITQNQLYGSFDEVTREWSDGIAAELIRNAVRDNHNPDHHWVMFDGPVDALWIESMNTVLDDNKKLCLVSGEIIALTSKMRMQFEVEDLEVASPATVSRCGMIYMEPESLGFDVFWDSWLEVLPETFKMKPEFAVTLQRLCKEIIPPTLQFLRKFTVEVVATQDNNLIQSLFRLLDCYFKSYVPNELRPAASFKEEINNLKTALVPLFFFCMVWSLGASCNGPTRPKFSRYVWAMIHAPTRAEISPELEKVFIPLPPHQEGVEFIGIPTPGDDLYNYFYSIETKTWVSWLETIPNFEVPRSAKYEEIVVPSLDSIRLVYIFQLLVLNDFHVLCPGPTGTGKSTNIGLWLQKSAPEHVQGTFINFSAQTHVNQLQDLIDSKLEKRRRGTYGPPAGKKMVLFIDDLNMPLKEYFGAQPPVELIRQWHDHRGWFNRKELTKFSIIDVVMVSAMGPPGGGRTFITPRLKRHYSTTAYADFTDTSITRIFETISRFFFSTFDEKVQSLIPGMIAATINVFKRAWEDLLPTPSKSHYLFNLRDIWKVFLGLCALSPKKSGEPMTVTRCWAHEIQRIFGDRLTDKNDLEWMRTQINTNVVNIFKLKPEDVFANPRLVFGSFLTTEIDNRVYEEISDMKVMKETIEEYLEDYNNVNTIAMPLVMFLDACEHCSRICRVLAQPSGHVLLLGVGGSGRQSLTRLSCSINDVGCFQIEVAKGYGMMEFKDDLKRCLMKCGVEDKVQVFLFCDTQIVKEDFVEAINNVLNSGDVPNLYATEDFEGISSSCRAVCMAMGYQPTKANLFAAYLSRVKKNVHVTLAFSPVGDSFRNRLRMFPSLVACCTIDWFHEWPAEALYSVAKQQILGANVELPNLEGSLTMFKTIHQSVEGSAHRFFKATNRNVYVTPTSYLELLSSFMQILSDKRTQVSTQQTRYSVGLTKIMNAEEQVSGLQQMLVEKKPALEKTQKEVAEMMVVIKKDKADAQEVSTAVAAEEASASIKADEVQVVKDDAQRDLDEALPALDEAVKCLSKLSKSDIQEIKVLGNPPAGVKLACEGCCILLGLKPVRKQDKDSGKKVDDYWETSQKVLLTDAKKLLEDLQEFDKDNIPEDRINKITPYMSRDDFEPSAIKKASIACEAICMWTRAMYKYHFIAKNVEPKRIQLRQAEQELIECNEKLQTAQDTLRKVNAKIAKLEADFSSAVEKQKELQDDMTLCEIKLVRAHKLIGGLGGEKARWGQNVKDLMAQGELLPGDCIVAAGMVSYVGPFTASYRLECEELWRKELTKNAIEHNHGANMYSVLGDPVKIQSWVVCSLPNDALSIENGIIIDRSRRWPLMIDPQRQANKYIRSMGKDTETGIDVCKLSEKNFLRTLELGIQFGKWILLENIGLNLDPALEPVLLQQKVKDGSGYVIKLGDKSVTYSDTFKFFMTTTLPNPHYSPETSVKVTLLNFAITPTGLEDQMLGIVVAKERPDLEQQKNELVVQNAKMNRDLKEIEDDILKLLATSEGDVLEDDKLVNKVTSSKEVSDDINAKKKVARVTEENIDVARESYRPVAYRTAVLFFCIVELTNIDPMYQYSLQWFQKLFTIAIDASPKAEVLEDRLNILKDFFTESLYQNICRGLFEKDKTLFSFALCTRILKGDNKIDDAELRYLLVGPTADMTENGPEIPAEWVGKPRWNEILTISQLPAFKGFSDVFVGKLPAFMKIYDSVEADKEPLPEPWQSKLTSLQRLCFIRAMRTDCLGASVITFISDEIGQRFVEPPTFDIQKSFADSSNTTPLIFILSPGTDPVADVITFADKLGMLKRFESMSLGQGQGPKATKIIDVAQGTGGWVLLSNCHLMESWMSKLEALVEQLNPETMSNNFRLWLTSMPANSFPVQVLQNGVKMTNQPPAGLRANLLRSYSTITDDFLKQSEKPEVFKLLLFGFCFFHAIVQDRRKYGPIGWNIAYGFTPEDLQVCKEQLMLFINQYEEVPYKVLNFLGAKINYGGRVTDDKDKLLISTIIQTFICPAVVKEKDTYKYSTSGTYYAPQAETIAEFIEYIRGLPLYPMPEAFGLHENCNITCAQDEALMLLGGMQKMVQLGGGGEGGQSAEDVMDEAASSIQDRLPEPYPLDICEIKFPTLYQESMNTVVKQECLRYNQLLWCMASTLKDFRKAIKGLIVMTGELEALGKSLFVNEQPELWVKKGPLSLKPLSSWYLDILARCEFFQEWYDLGHAPPVFWVSGIFFPQAFFTGAIQNYARKYNEEIDLLSYRQIVRDEVIDPKGELTKPPQEGVYIYGIFMEGCRWASEQHQLADSRPKELFTDLPCMWFLPIKNREPDLSNYRCPCYKVVSRKGVLLTTGHSTNFVMYIELKTDMVQDKWIKAGVAAFLALRF